MAGANSGSIGRGKAFVVVSRTAVSAANRNRAGELNIVAPKKRTHKDATLRKAD